MRLCMDGTPLRCDSALTGSKRCILECLGAAVFKLGNASPASVQRALFRGRRSKPRSSARLEALGARFIQHYRDSAASMAVKF